MRRSEKGLLLTSGLQKFDKQPEYTEVNPGEDVKLTCTILNKKGTCSWQKNNKGYNDENIYLLYEINKLLGFLAPGV
ncbi:hypothetical protein Phum_PHUM586020 [Pediculus humanus corporis]|uniref:Ig-like domain-containing protein n=1 Tax=Pediculus humanus subsp. corporis TaxID=121224 RepID=E0W269_PEDHC|nr:uncharacterized protein Phum_PHUM586020 [Pediculus humanus corporis]EEB19725.1 hypothetical protein Phum_PHUM586020 [Pediculus humanus corporis]